MKEIIKHQNYECCNLKVSIICIVRDRVDDCLLHYICNPLVLLIAGFLLSWLIISLLYFDWLFNRVLRFSYLRFALRSFWFYDKSRYLVLPHRNTSLEQIPLRNVCWSWTIMNCGLELRNEILKFLLSLFPYVLNNFIFIEYFDLESLIFKYLDALISGFVQFFRRALHQFGVYVILLSFILIFRSLAALKMLCLGRMNFLKIAWLLFQLLRRMRLL